MKHKHYDCIVAWAEGRQIQYLSTSDKDWRDCINQPFWVLDTEYRIKPEINVSFLLLNYPYEKTWFEENEPSPHDCIKIIRDAQGRLISAEVIK